MTETSRSKEKTDAIWNRWRTTKKRAYIVLPDKRKYRWIHNHIFQKLGKMTNVRAGKDDEKLIWSAIENRTAVYEVINPS